MNVRHGLLALMWVALLPLASSGATYRSDIVVFGATSGGVVAACEAARLGKSVQLVEPGKHVGGMTSGGLGWIDYGRKEAIGGMSRQFFGHVYKAYKDLPPKESAQGPGWTVEPHVAERIFLDMLAGDRVATHFDEQLAGARMDGRRIAAITTGSGDVFQARVFIDATYEGDLMAAAKVSFTTVREADDQYREDYNGFRITTLKVPVAIDPYIVPGRPQSGLIDLVQDARIQKTGDSSPALQCYNYRLCLTRNASNRIPIDPPANYDPKHYELVARFIAARTAAGAKLVFGNGSGDFNAFLKISPLPHGKTDINQSSFVGTDHVGYSTEYPTASYARRDAIAREHEGYTRGFLHFLATDPRVPENVRAEASQWGLCLDEFPDTHGWPYQLYVREGRRMVGSYVMTQHDCESKTNIPDPVGLGSYSMDSHACQRMVVDGKVVNEGQFYTRIARPYPISYRAIVPKLGECTNLLVPACCSASHVAYASVRMEPVFMILGQSAATAGAIAVDRDIDVQSVDYGQLAAALERDGQVLRDAPPAR
jgi:hypothetical protein